MSRASNVEPSVIAFAAWRQRLGKCLDGGRTSPGAADGLAGSGVPPHGGSRACADRARAGRGQRHWGPRRRWEHHFARRRQRAGRAHGHRSRRALSPSCRGARTVSPPRRGARVPGFGVPSLRPGGGCGARLRAPRGLDRPGGVSRFPGAGDGLDHRPGVPGGRPGRPSGHRGGGVRRAERRTGRRGRGATLVVHGTRGAR